ncbi:MAG: aliphatic sulfonate ABC transporter substrate-binding protein [Rhodospirillaceae bacterium]|nr:aliphatic sulfonate ABC transporter substrate-binding protein [Rhodospirillaceae bacterium]
MFWTRRTLLATAAIALAAGPALTATAGAEAPKRLTLDWAYYNPVSLVLKDKRWVEQEFAKDGIAIRWVQSHGSNKALEFLNAGAVEFGSTAGAAALLGKINGNPIKAIYVYSKPEWTALVTRPKSGIKTVADLKGKRVAVTRGTDPYIFLLRALAGAGLTERDIRPVLVQHADGRTALERGDVDAWAGLDPMMAETELEQGSVLFYRNADANTYGVLNVREAFAKEHPEIVIRVLRVYERGRKWALANPAALRDILAKAARLKPNVAAKQLERTDLTDSSIGAKPTDSILAAGLALQKSGVIDAKVDVKAAVTALIEPRFAAEAAKRDQAQAR